MGKKSGKKEALPFTERLAQQLGKGSSGDLAAQAAAEGLDNATFEADFEKARSLCKQGPDPRQVAALPAAFQLAILKLLEQDRDCDPITDLLAISTDREVQKEARRALHRLRSKGLRVELPDQTGSSVLERRVLPEEQPLACFIGPIDVHGDKFVLLARYVHGGVAFYQSTLNDQLGLVDFTGGTIGRNRYRSLIRDMLAGGDHRLLEIPYAEARQAVSAAAARSREAKQPLPEGYLEASQILPEAQPQMPAPDPRAAFPLESLSGNTALIQESVSLHDLPEFDSWQLPEDTLKEITAKLEEIRNSQLVVTEQQRLDQVKRVIDGATGLLLKDEQRRARFQERLLDIALHLQRTGHEDRARQAAAAAWQLSAEGFKPEESPFFDRLARKLFRPPEEILKSMGPASAPPEEQKPDPGKLIVAP